MEALLTVTWWLGTNIGWVAITDNLLLTNPGSRVRLLRGRPPPVPVRRGRPGHRGQAGGDLQLHLEDGRGGGGQVGGAANQRVSTVLGKNRLQ